METTPNPDPHDVEHLAALRERLEALDREREGLRARIQRVQQGTAHAPGSAPRSPAQKIELFRSLFAGRPDVFALRWSSTRTGRSGYSPACANEWVRDLCRKPEVKCAVCPHRSLRPLTDEVLLGHLQGRHVVGLYPLLPDGSCYLVAIDLDKHAWREDVVAVRESARSFGLSPLVERSRSGAGAHVWLFFEEPVSAAQARRLADRVLLRAMDSRDRLPLASFDRMFPNQDTIPDGGFGNLIALPLQLAARREGNSQFLDDALTPIEDPWPLLAAVQRVSTRQLEAILEKDVASKAEAPRHHETPWALARPPRAEGLLTGRRMHVVRANRLYIRRKGLPSAALAALRRTATRRNPDHVRRSKSGMPTYGTPRFVSVVEDHDDWLGLPRGLEKDLRTYVREAGGEPRFRDRRIEGTPHKLDFHGKLRTWQEVALGALIEHDLGVLVAPPGAGKTVLGIALLARRAVSALVLVHRKSLADQWQARIEQFLGLKPRQIGRYGGGRRRLRGTVDVATLQALARARNLDELLAPYGQVLVDECHHIPADSFEAVVGRTSARRVTGLTATPMRRDGLEELIFMHCGPVRHHVKVVGGPAACAKHLVVRRVEASLGENAETSNFAALLGELASSEARTARIVQDVASAANEGRKVLVLTERRAHIDTLRDGLCRESLNVVTLHGGLGARARKEALRTIAPDGDVPQVVVATGRFAGEGLDLPHLDTLFLALPISWKGTVSQYVGRLDRAHPGKMDVRVVDYVDFDVPLLARMFERRLRTYHSLGYEEDAPLPFASHADGAGPRPV